LSLGLAAGAAMAADDAAREAGAALARGNLDQAAALYSQALQDKTLPNERRAILLSDRGVVYARQQNPKDAIEDFNRAIQLFPEYAAIYNNRGNVLLGIGAVREAMKDFDRALLLAPGYAAAYSNRAGARLRLGEIDPAMADYSRALGLSPASPAALTGRGRAHLAAGRPHAAIRDLTRAVSFDARFSAAYRARAEAKSMIERHDEAIEDFSRAIAFEAKNAELYILRGGAYLAAENAASAVKDFTTAVELTPRNARAHAARGLAYAKGQAYEDALNDLGRAIELEPRSPRAFAYRAWTYRQQQPDLGLKDVERALKLDPSCAEAYWARGEIEEVRGQAALAIADLTKALQLEPRLKDARTALQRLGAGPLPVDEEVADAGLDRWRVFAKWPQYVATNDQYPRLKVDIEMVGKGRPRILEWELKTAPYAGIGVLRYHAGVADGPRGAEEVEQVAIVDVQASTVLAVETHRRGSKLAQLTWDGGKLVLASADGTTEELALRSEKPAVAPPKKVAAPQEQWSPWGSTWDSGKKRPKTLFELLFGN
jgi:tetratricopeptide (TPR) repeat protein